ncbi:Ste2 mating-type alpha pheromone receptor [Erysiphe neolycopersici]|uniref:Ste2 mating-type alpha pheromone receptor n=1 Tax=Erysiphe neolycopersici TaxID=212602 RepID=A0A420HVE9_9PEZI|nr:Ste2 mating-type alpha pheromone receptor [Erysiphe neolycopersici]
MASTVSHSFNYSSQEINPITADDTVPITILIKSIDEWNLFNVAASISFGVQAGTFCIMFFTTAVLTRSTKLRMPVHILNLLSLFLGFFRSLFQALYYTSNWSRFQAHFLHNYSDVSFRNYFVSILSIITPLLFATTVTISLAFQAHTVTKILNKKWHNLISFLSTLVFLLSVGFRFTNTVYNCKAVVQTKPYFNFEWLQLSVLISETIIIWFYSLIFTGKLVFHMWRWRYSNKRMYLQIPVIMGTCTMIIPSIFALIHFVDVPTFPSIDTWPLVVVALLLPMSTLWTTMEPNPSFDILKAWGNHSSEQLFINGGCESSNCKNLSQNLKFGPGRHETKIFSTKETDSTGYAKSQATTNSSFSRDSLKGYSWKADDHFDRTNNNHSEKN